MQCYFYSSKVREIPIFCFITFVYARAGFGRELTFSLLEHPEAGVPIPPYE